MGHTEVSYSAAAQVVFWVFIWGVFGKGMCVWSLPGSWWSSMVVDREWTIFSPPPVRDENINMGKIERQTDK